MIKIKRFFRNNLPIGSVNFLRGRYRWVKGFFYNDNLDKLAKMHSCDKGEVHNYTPIYSMHFNSYKNKKIKLLEIGIGGYERPDRGGASLRLWKDYFRKGNIYGIDIHDKSKLDEKRIKTFQGSQTDQQFLEETVQSIGDLNIIIDDGSHVSEDIIKSFKVLFPLLKKGGVYVVEDMQCSYWHWYGGNSKNIDDPSTAINFFKNLVHGLNYKEFIINNYEPTYFDQNIISIHFYHNILFIYKGDNDRKSSYLINNELPQKR